MRKEIRYINYICDCCQKESKDNNFLTNVILPATRCIPSDDQGPWNFVVTTAGFEICSECMMKMYKLLGQKFEIKDVDGVGTSIRIKHLYEDDVNTRGEEHG